MEWLRLAIEQEARAVARKWGSWVDEEDVSQELWLYVLGRGRETVDRNLARGAQGRSNVRQYLKTQALRYAHQEKAARTGYRQEDVTWLSEKVVRRLMPYVLDPEWDGTVKARQYDAARSALDPQKVMVEFVIDLKRVLRERADLLNVLTTFPVTAREYREAIYSLVELLGGWRPAAPGYQGTRRVISNSAALAVAKEHYDPSSDNPGKHDKYEERR